jgi:hypothetical protein
MSKFGFSEQPFKAKSMAFEARLLLGCLAYNLLHMIRDAAFWGRASDHP